MPRWMAAHPHLSSRLLAWKNAYRYRPGRTLLAAVLVVVGLVVVAVLPPTGPILGWLGRNWAITFVIATSLFALSTARRRQRASIAATTSWLASLPAGSPPWMQAMADLGGRLMAILTFIALMWLAGVIDRSGFSRLAVATAAGALVGMLAGWRLPRAGIGAPGFHFAIVRRTRAHWASAPSLSPLGNWPAAQARIFSRPKRMAPMLIIAMMAIPSGLRGSPGQVALAVAGVCMALFSVFSLTAAAVRVAFEAARWLAPTTVGRWRFTAALIWRVGITQTLALAVLLLLTSSIYLHGVLAIGVPLAALYLCASLAVAVITVLWACQRAGLGASGRGV
jgi:hypothetical protein